MFKVLEYSNKNLSFTKTFLVRFSKILNFRTFFKFENFLELKFIF